MSDASHRILTTHVGSLPRPEKLVEFMRKRMQSVPVDDDGFERCLASSIDAVVRRQIAIGIDIVSDGEFGKVSWARYVLDRLSGIESRPAKRAPLQHRSVDRARFPDYYAEYDREQQASGPNRTWVVTGAVRYTGHALLRGDIERLKSALHHTNAVDAFLPVVAPGSIIPDGEDEYYGSDEKAIFAIADAMHEEYRAIVDAGFVVQVDDAWLTGMYDRMVPPASLDDYLKWASLRVEALNHALQGLPQARTRYHICWGSWSGPHTSDVPLKDIIDLVTKVRVGGYSFEAANVRHEHEHRVWCAAKIPDHVVLLPGVVSHATNVVEHPELVAERLLRFTDIVGRERVIASTDCGFAQGAFYSRVHPTIVWAKLAALVEGARLASRLLWPRN